MDAIRGSQRRARLHVVRPGPAVDCDRLGREVLACVAAQPGGLAPSLLIPRLAERLEVEPEAIDERDLDVALGLLVVTGRLDESGGLLVVVGEAARLTG